MSSTACDDQLKQAPPEDLEQQCRDARAKAKETCVWRFDRNKMGGRAECVSSYWHYSPEYKVCPFCAKPIEIKK
jgi:hypothetical protein